jgi:hypothetical protein
MHMLWVMVSQGEEFLKPSKSDIKVISSLYQHSTSTLIHRNTRRENSNPWQHCLLAKEVSQFGLFSPKP